MLIGGIIKKYQYSRGEHVRVAQYVMTSKRCVGIEKILLGYG